MKKISIIVLLLVAQTGFAQDCNTKAASKPSAFVRVKDYYDRSVDDPKANISPDKLKPQLTAAENWMKGILKNFTGVKQNYYNNYLFNYTFDAGKNICAATGIKGTYYANMMFFAYYCYEGRDEVFTEGESGSSLQVLFNNLIMTPTLCSDVSGFTVNGKYAFKMLEKYKTEGRIDYYELLGMSNVNDTVNKSKSEYIIIRNSDQPVYIPITRKEYLQQLLKDIEIYKAREIADAKQNYTPASEAANKASFDEQLKRIDNSKTYTPEQMAPYRKRFIETWETEKQKFDKRMARLEKETNEARDLLQEYLKKPEEWANRSFKQFYGGSSYSAGAVRSYLESLDVFAYSREDDTRTNIVTINPAYFNKSLSGAVPQMIMVYLPKGRYAHMKKVADLVHAPGALKPLENILTPGKLAAEQPAPVTTSVYKLSLLPKLNKLTPVVVPADIKLPMVAAIPSASVSPATKPTIETPALSPKLKQLPIQPFTFETYKNYLVELHTKIAGALKPEIKKKADDYIKKQNSARGMGNTALAAWLQKSPDAGLYIYSKAVVQDPADALTANNFSAFLIMACLPERSIPVLEYLNKQKPGTATILANLGNAYYRLGDVNNAMQFLQQCVQKDSLHPTANKILCLMYLEKGDVKKAEEHATRSISKCHDEEMISIIRQLNNKAKVGEIMSRFPPLPEKEFPVLKRIQLPQMPSNLDDMEQFAIELNAMKQSMKKTIDAINAKYPNVDNGLQQQQFVAGFKNGISPMRLKAQYIIMDGMQIYQADKIKEDEVFKYNLKKLRAPYNAKVKAIQKKYADQMKKLEGGEAGDEDKIQELERARCIELNTETQTYLTLVSALVNQYAQRAEYISRRFFRDYANQAPYWMPQTNSFPSIERDYLKDVLNILDSYEPVSKSACGEHEPLAEKQGSLQEWEDEYCADYKGKIGIGPAKLTWTCHSWGVEGGEGIVGGFEVNYSKEGSFEDLTLELGLGAEWKTGIEHIAEAGAGASVKEFVKLGFGGPGEIVEVKDAGIKGEISIEGGIGNVSGEAKILEVSAGYRSGVEKQGILMHFLDSK